MAKVKDVCYCTTGTDSNGAEKKFWHNCGAIVETAKGGLCLILEGPQYPNGKLILQLFDPKPKQDGLKKAAALPAVGADLG
jgi:hypothetical protein